MTYIKTIIALFSFLILHSACEKISSSRYKAELQGEWKNAKTQRLAFSVRGDSLYASGLASGHSYQFEGDTLVVHFESETTRSRIIHFDGKQLTLISDSVMGDTILLEKIF